MKVGGFSAGISNPAFLAVLGLQALNTFQNARANAANTPNPDDAKFKNAALSSGAPVTSMPGGFFRQALSHTGLVSPDIQASPDQLAQENMALQHQQSQNIQALAPIISIRHALGKQPFADLMNSPHGGPIMDTLSRVGISPDALMQDTPEEMKAAGELAHQKTADDRMQAQADETKRYHDIEAGNSNARLGLEKQRLGLAEHSAMLAGDSPEALRVEENRTNARARGTLEATGDINLGDWDKSTFIGPDLKPFRGNDTIKTPRQAREAGYTEVQKSDKGTLTAINSATNDLAQLKELVPKVLVSTRGMSTSAANIAIRKNQANLLFSKNPDVVAFRALIDSSKPIVSTYYALQHRAPPTIEIKNGSVLLPSLGSDSYETGMRKIEDLDESLKAGYRLKPATPTLAVPRTKDTPPDALKPLLSADGELLGYRMSDGSAKWLPGKDPYGR